MDVQGKVAIVTGASSGIGLATAKSLSNQGANVVLAARSTEKLADIAKHLPHSHAVTTDMLKEKDIKNLIKKTLDKFGRIDILVNNAGRGYDALIEQISPQLFQELFQLDVVGPLIAMQLVLPYMKKQGSGAIVNISSGTSLMTIPGMSAYSSMKRALNGISLTAREELADDNIKVSVIYPYITETDFDKHMMGELDYHDIQNTPSDLPPADSADYVAKKILKAIESGDAEVYAHDWMKRTD